MYNSLNFKSSIVFHKGFAIYRNNKNEVRVENAAGHTIDLVFWSVGDAIQWINEVI